MSNIGIISDIHSNMESLTKAQRIMEERGVEEVFCLGDVVGYGPDPASCLHTVKRLCSSVIQGNHDAGVGDRNEYYLMNSLAKAGIDYAARQLDHNSTLYLNKLPRMMVKKGLGISLAHGSLTGDHFDYIMDGLSALDNFLAMTTQCLFVGHSHHTFISELPFSEHSPFSEPSFLTFRDEGTVTVTLKEANRYIINPGSVGQPRDVPLASLCILNTDANTVSFVRYTYDVDQTVTKIKKAGLPDWAWQRLLLGR